MELQQERIRLEDFLEWKGQAVTIEFFTYLQAKIADYESSVMATVLNRELIKPDQLEELNNDLVYYHALVELFNLTPNDINTYYADKEPDAA